jgi:hypothetical protein
MFFKELHVETGFIGEWLVYITKKIYSKQPAAIVRTQGNFTARVSRDCLVTKISVAIRNAFPDNGIPEQNTGFG